MVPSAHWMEYGQALLAPSKTARPALTTLAGLYRGRVWLMWEGEKEPYMCPFTLWNGADTLYQTHLLPVAVLQMTDEGRAEYMDPSPILGGLGCSEKGRVFGTSFAICRLLGAHNASSVLGHRRGLGECASARGYSQYSMLQTLHLCRFHRSSQPWPPPVGLQHNLVSRVQQTIN